MRAQLWTSFLCAAALATFGCKDDGNGGGGNGRDGGSFTTDGGFGGGDVVVYGITPDHGPLSGGTEITISGEGFVLANAGENMVLVGGMSADSITTIDDRTIRAVVPEGAASILVDVTVFNSNGFFSLVDSYSYNPTPIITDISPPDGDRAGGAAITLTGTGFMDLEAGTNSVMFGSQAGTDVTVSSDTSLQVTAPAGAPYSITQVSVTNDNGTSNEVDFKYTAHGVLAIGNGRPGFDGFGALYFVDVSTGLSQLLCEVKYMGIPWGAVSLATHPDGTIYAALSSVSSSGPRTLATIDPFSCAASAIGDIPLPSPGGPSGMTASDMEFDGTTLLANDRCSGLYSLALDSATPVAIGDGGFCGGGRGIAIVGSTTYVNENASLYTINKADGQIQTGPIAITGLQQSDRINGLTAVDGVLYGSAVDRPKGPVNDGAVYSIAPGTGAVTIVTRLSVHLDAITKTPF